MCLRKHKEKNLQITTYIKTLLHHYEEFRKIKRLSTDFYVGTQSTMLRFTFHCACSAIASIKFIDYIGNGAKCTVKRNFEIALHVSTELLKYIIHEG